jgi:hypothetical protein
MMNRFRRMVASLLIVCITGLGLPLPAMAGLVTTDRITANAERDRVALMLERNDVRSQLQTLGVDPAQVKARVDALGDDEVAQLARQIETLPAGGNSLIGAIVFVFLVLLVTDLLGLTNIFPFTRNIR